MTAHCEGLGCFLGVCACVCDGCVAAKTARSDRDRLVDAAHLTGYKSGHAEGRAEERSAIVAWLDAADTDDALWASLMGEDDSPHGAAYHIARAIERGAHVKGAP
jgi:hypothetical protein